MIRVAICHEKELTRSLLRAYCTDYFCVRGIEFEVKEYTSGESMLVKDFPDVLFLGIRTGQIDGILVKEILQKLKAQTRIVFAADGELRIFEAFGKNVYGFVQEPIKYPVFRKKMMEVVWDYFEESNYIFCKSGKQIEKISLLEVLYIEAYGKYTKIYAKGKKDYFLCEKCMSDWVVEQERSIFLWCHRRFLVNLLHIHQIQTNWIELEQGIMIPFSRRRRKECHDIYQHFVGRFGNYEKRCGTVYGYFKAEL